MSIDRTERFDEARQIVPDFGRMLHLPHEPNCDRDDLVATHEEASAIFFSDRALVEEKLDGSQVGVASAGDGSPPIVRNKNHILVKGYGRKGTNAKAQYAPLWNWVYEHAKQFAALKGYFSEVVGVYGEWLYAQHTIPYDFAPDDFIAYQIYRPSLGAILDPEITREALAQAGFFTPHLLATHVSHYDQLAALTCEISSWSLVERREGVVVKIGDGERLVSQFKMRRFDFQPREGFNDEPMRRRHRPTL